MDSPPSPADSGSSLRRSRRRSRRRRRSPSSSSGERRFPARSPTLMYNRTVAAPGSDPAHPTATGMLVNEPAATLGLLLQLAGMGRTGLDEVRVLLFHSWTTSFHQVAVVNASTGLVWFQAVAGTEFDGAMCSSANQVLECEGSPGATGQTVATASG